MDATRHRHRPPPSPPFSPRKSHCTAQDCSCGTRRTSLPLQQRLAVADMQPKTSKVKPKNVERFSGSLQRRFFFRVPTQIQNAARTFTIEGAESLQGTTEHLSSRGVTKLACLEYGRSHCEGSSVGYSPIISKKAIPLRSSSSDEENILASLEPHNCLTLWKHVALQHLKWCTERHHFHNMTVSFSSCSLRGVSKVQRGRSMPAKAVTFKGDKACEIKKRSCDTLSWRYFAYDEIACATNFFHPDNIIGKGGYAEVYKGNLSNGQVIAVKKLIQDKSDDQREKDFLVEIGIMGHICHPNTAALIGFCLEGGLHLVFHFYIHGSLASHLHGTKHQTLGWPIRYRVAVGTARGLHYLHKHCQHRIIHRDIKSSNILLGEDFEPQISDFGLAKWLPKQWTHHSVNPVEGTLGYLAPEYFMHGIVDEKTDVFAFGVLLLEIISGRRPTETSQQSLVLWAMPLLESGNIQELADPQLRGSFDLLQMQRLMITAVMCVRESAISRPSMSQVLELLTQGYSSAFPNSCRFTF